MKKFKQYLTIKYVLAIFLTIILIYIYNSFYNNSDTNYKIAIIKKGSIESVVNTTGTIEPQIKAELIPHIAGIIKDIYVDHNSVVKKGDILALLYNEQYILNLKQAEANFLKAMSDLEYTRNIFESNKKLFDKNHISRQELNNSKVNYSSSLALYEQANVLLQKSKTDLNNTKIISPIDGVVIGKNIIEGQAVSDRLDQKPVFTIVNNLMDMNIIAPVNEVDIGKLKIGNPVTFVTDAFPDDTYIGSIKQIVSEPTSLNNIVTYNIIIQFENTNYLLKPGMTANIEILARAKSDVLIVPKAALRFIPNSYSRLARDYSLSAEDKVIWLLDDDNKLHAVKITTGVNNATNIEIVDGDVKENDIAVIGYTIDSKTENNSVGPIKIPGVKRF